MIGRDLEFVPSSLLFHRDTSLVQSIRVTAQETGYYFVTYSISGPNAHEFSLPEEDVLFVESYENSTKNPLIEESTLYFPPGCHKKQVGVCPGDNVTPIVVSSTCPFVYFGPLMSTQGIVTLEVGSVSKIPLSLRGVNVQHPKEESFPDSCNDNDVSYSTKWLIKSRALVKLFTSIVAESLPTWINITLSESNMAQNIHSSDLTTHFLTGLQLQEANVGEGLPLVHDMFYSLLATKNLNVSIQNDVDVFQSNALSLAVELCQEPPLDVMLQKSFEVEEGLVKHIQIFKNLREYGWNFIFKSIQFSKTNRIVRPAKRTFWDGKHFVNMGALPGGNFAAVMSLKKHFQNPTFADIRIEFDGTLIGNVKDINQVGYLIHPSYLVYFYMHNFTILQCNVLRRVETNGINKAHCSKITDVCKFFGEVIFGFLCWCYTLLGTNPTECLTVNFTKDYTLYLLFTAVISLHKVVTSR